MPVGKTFQIVTALFLLSVSLKAQSTERAVPVLQRVEQALGSLDRISYHYRRELNYASEDYHNVVEADVNLEFDSSQHPIGAIYQVHSPAGFEIFNGSEILSANAAKHTLRMTPVHKAQDLDHVTFLFNSMLTLHAALPSLIADPAVTKSVVAETPATLQVELRLPQATLSYTGSRTHLTLARDTIYSISIDRATWLPVEVRQTNTQNKDFMLVDFTNINSKAPSLPADSWFYSSYSDYQLVTPGSGKKLAAVGATAPDWTLPVAGHDGSTASLASKLAENKTKLVLVEFWISHCGPSIDAVPGLNGLESRFAAAGLRILAVNPDDSENTIRTFVRNNSPHYTLLAEGQKAQDAYGVSSFPTAFLIDKQDKIVYAGELDPNVLAQKIAAALQ